MPNIFDVFSNPALVLLHLEGNIVIILIVLIVAPTLLLTVLGYQKALNVIVYLLVSGCKVIATLSKREGVDKIPTS